MVLSWLLFLAFLKGHYLFLSSVVISLYLVLVIWKLLVLPKRVASLASISFWSCWKYSNLFFFFFYKLYFLSFLPYLSLCYFPHLLNSMLNITGLYYLLLLDLELLLLFMPSLHFTVLFFKHLSIILGNIRGNGGRNSNTEEKKVKISLFYLYIVNLGIIMGFFR